MSDVDHFGADDYQEYADSFAQQREHEADERDHEEQERVDRLRRDWPVTRLPREELVRLFVARGYDLSVARRMAIVQTTCSVCMEREGKAIYGMLCQVCHEARREERDAA